MINHIKLLLFIGLAWGQDEYPYFNDISKQLKFEQKKIVVQIDKERRQVISGGGSEFNWLSLVSNYQPTYLIAPMKTDFEYISKFSIEKNNVNISEIDFLRSVGLIEQADSLVSSYQKKLSSFNEYDNLVLDRDNYVFRKGILGGCGSLFGMFSLVLSKEQAFKEPSLVYLTSIVSISSFTGFFLTKKSSFMIKDKNNYPQLKSFLSNEQVKSISEAYNRKLYKDISNK